ncbi:MAG: energy-coupling factor transporter ATPase [Coprobacillus sp.]
MWIYKVDNLSFQYQSDHYFSLKDLSFEIEEGSFNLICGKSGSGKTTLLQLLKKEMMPHGYMQGSIQTNIQNDKPEDIGYIFQNPDFQIVTHKVMHELSFGLENMAMPLTQMKRRIGEVVNFFNLQSLLHKDISELSGGQKQLVNLASVVVMQPKVMLLDEPTAQLDPIASQEFISILKKVNEELNITIIMIEHDMEKTLSLSDYVIYLEDGVMKYQGPSIGMVDIHNFQKALPVTMQMYHKFDIKNKGFDFKTTRKWLNENTNHLHIIEKEKQGVPDICIQVSNLHFHYDNLEVLKGTYLDVYKNEILALVGGNGSGKSTFLKNICGLLKYDRGKVLINNNNLKDINAFQDCFAYLPQDPTSMFLKETVQEELNNEESLKWLQTLELNHLLGQHPYDLSGGQMQLIALIKILSLHPQILLLDEPTKGLDAYYKEKVGLLLKELSQTMTIIVVSHDLEFCAHYASRVGLMFEGRIESVEDTQMFFASNLFYTTIIAKLTRGIIDNACVLEDIVYE